MSTLTDWELIQDFAERRSDAAFAELVHRHLDFVYASAVRQIQRPDLARDVTQAVFLLLARKASSLRRGVILSGWLFRSARFLAARAVREENRRRRREQEAAQMILEHQTPNPSEELRRELELHLDDALAALGEADRNIVLLRYFERQHLHEVGERLGLSEAAARKRVARAVEKLRSFFNRRGLTLSSAALMGLLWEWQSNAAPTGLAQTVCAAVGAGVGAAGATSTVAALVAAGLRDWAWFQAKAILLWAAGVAAVVVGTGLWLGVGGHQPAIDTPTISTPGIPLPASTAPNAAPSPPQQRAEAASRSAGHRFLLNVLDRESNQPIPDARVLAEIGDRGGDGRFEEQRTGQDGLCEFTVPDKPFHTFLVWLCATGYVPVVMSWAAHEFTDSDVLYVCKLIRGTVLKGEVRDEQGQPVTDAQVQLSGPGTDMARRENTAYNPRLATTRTDQAGHFYFDQLPIEWEGGPIRVGVTHRSFATVSFWLQGAQEFATNRVVTLTRGVPLRGQVIGPRGDPVAGATVGEAHTPFGLETKTDFQGRFEFNHATVGTHTLVVRAEGYNWSEQAVLAGANEPEVTLQLRMAKRGEPSKPNPLRLHGTVVDAENSEPVPNFNVVFDAQLGSAKRLLGEGSNGAFDWKMERASGREFSLEVDADGFFPQTIKMLRTAAEDYQFEFRLKRGANLTGVVLQPDGQPAAHAAAGLATRFKYGPVLSAGGKLMNDPAVPNRTEVVATDTYGRFSLRPKPDAERILITHETGCAEVPVTTLTTNHMITLSAWGEVEGLLHNADGPAENVSIRAASGPGLGQDSLWAFDEKTRTDSKGRFRLRYVPPAELRVSWHIDPHNSELGNSGSGHAETVTVRAGETAHVALGGNGVTVVGRLVLSPPLTNYNWTLDPQALVQRRPDLPQVHRRDSPNDEPALFHALAVRDSEIAKYYLVIQPDGAFRADDVLPGNYVLQVKISAPPEEPVAKEIWLQPPRREIGKVDLPVVIPEPNSDKPGEPLDLGVITIPVTNSAPVARR